MSEAASITHLDRLDLRFAPRPWSFASERRAEIDAHFATIKRAKPGVWNGRVLLMHTQEMTGGVLKGAFLETDYASFIAWCDWGRPPAAVYDCFGAAAIVSADNAVLLGVMGAHTYNAGHVYFPCGTPDPADLIDGKVDLEFSVWRELKEETGLSSLELAAEPGWTTVVDGALIANIKVLHSPLDAERLRARILRFLERGAQPELAGIHIVRGMADTQPTMRPFVLAFLAQRFAVR